MTFQLVSLSLVLALAGAACADPTAEVPTDALAGAAPATPSEYPVLEQAQPRAAPCSDMCPKRGGIEWLCKLRFMYGINYAWHHFGADFGGNVAWNQPGISNNPKVDSELGSFRASGSSVIRWWVFPDFRGDGVEFDARDRPTGVGGTLLADLRKALELAAKHDLYLMLTVFSFDNFGPTRTEGGLRIPGIRPMVVDAQRRAQLMERVVRPFARAAAESPHADRLIAWDVINEPEWAVSGESLYGDPDFTPQQRLEQVTHAQMETFLRDVIKVLQEETRALVSIGGAAVKWKNAWSKLDVDFHQFHIYDWVNEWWPYSKAPAELGVTDKPWVMGEFPLGGLKGASYGTLVDSWYRNGYAGALGWSYTDHKGGLGEVKAFADRHACEVRY